MLSYNDKAQLLISSKMTREVLSKELQDFIYSLYWGNESPYYALFDGGYIHPESILDAESANKVYNAMQVINNFFDMYRHCKGAEV